MRSSCFRSCQLCCNAQGYRQCCRHECRYEQESTVAGIQHCINKLSSSSGSMRAKQSATAAAQHGREPSSLNSCPADPLLECLMCLWFAAIPEVGRAATRPAARHLQARAAATTNGACTFLSTAARMEQRMHPAADVDAAFCHNNSSRAVVQRLERPFRGSPAPKCLGLPPPCQADISLLLVSGFAGCSHSGLGHCEENQEHQWQQEGAWGALCSLWCRGLGISFSSSLA